MAPPTVRRSTERSRSRANSPRSIAAAGCWRSIRTSSRVTRRPPPIKVGTDHILYLTGDDGNDTASVTLGTDGRLRATLNGTTMKLRAKGIVGVNMNVGEGTNSVTVDTDIPATITSGAGNDTITTASEDDTIVPGRGSNTINCGNGDDSIDIVYSKSGNSNKSDLHTISGGGGNKTIGVGGGRSKILIGGSGNNDITIHTQVADHEITIADGNNTLSIGGADVELTIGGSGRNNIVASVEHARIRTGAGNDTIEGHSGLFTIDAGAGDDTIANLGTDAPDVIEGGAGNDTISGGSGSDAISGGPGRDAISGGQGDDSINGGAGDDTIEGGNGDDELSGGTGPRRHPRRGRERPAVRQRRRARLAVRRRRLRPRPAAIARSTCLIRSRRFSDRCGSRQSRACGEEELAPLFGRKRLRPGLGVEAKARHEFLARVPRLDQCLSDRLPAKAKTPWTNLVNAAASAPSLSSRVMRTSADSIFGAGQNAWGGSVRITSTRESIAAITDSGP
jgi:hypothetical protein